MRKLIILIFLASIVSCATPTTPKFPEITCIPTNKLTDKQLTELSQCKKDVKDCTIPRTTLIQIFNNYQNKAACLEQYQETAKEFN